VLLVQDHNKTSEGSKMSSTPRHHQTETASRNVLPASWRELLGQCRRNPTPECVHRLRVVTVRLQAEGEYWLREHALEKSAKQAVRRWCKQGEKLRRALRAVREADVQLKQLASLRRPTSRRATAQSYCTPSCLLQIAKVEGHIAQKRRKAAKKLMGKLQERGARLDLLGGQLQAVQHAEFQPVALPPAVMLSQMFHRLSEDFPALDRDNLHAYRKRMKAICALAVQFGATDPVARRFSVSLKKMLAAIGKWHDWQALAQTVEHTTSTQEDGLRQMLEGLAAESLQTALRICREECTGLLDADRQVTLKP
jgi:hypothetical protein